MQAQKQAVIQKVALVTGANKGIGFAIVKQLAEHDSHLTVLLGSRDEARGRDAAHSINKANVESFAIDIDSEESVKSAADRIKEKYGGLDILVNNAGIASKGDAFDEKIAQQTQDTNYYGTLRVFNHFLPLLRDHARVVNVASRAGLLNKISNPALRDKFLSEDLSITQITELMRKFVQDVKEGTYASEGWPKNTYAVSKIGVSALTRVFAKEELKNSHREDVLIAACCPGWVRTDMAGDKAPKSPDEGAEVEVWLATLPEGAAKDYAGKFYAEKKEISYIDATF